MLNRVTTDCLAQKKKGRRFSQSELIKWEKGWEEMSKGTQGGKGSRKQQGTEQGTESKTTGIDKFRGALNWCIQGMPMKTANNGVLTGIFYHWEVAGKCKFTLILDFITLTRQNPLSGIDKYSYSVTVNVVQRQLIHHQFSIKFKRLFSKHLPIWE